LQLRDVRPGHDAEIEMRRHGLSPAAHRRDGGRARIARGADSDLEKIEALRVGFDAAAELLCADMKTCAHVPVEGKKKKWALDRTRSARAPAIIRKAAIHAGIWRVGRRVRRASATACCRARACACACAMRRATRAREVEPLRRVHPEEARHLRRE